MFPQRSSVLPGVAVCWGAHVPVLLSDQESSPAPAEHPGPVLAGGEPLGAGTPLAPRGGSGGSLMPPRGPRAEAGQAGSSKEAQRGAACPERALE